MNNTITNSEEKLPFISVLMTAYNREKYIAEAIESVRASSYTNWELIITDDCSTDKTLEIARNFESQDTRIRVFRNEINLGDYPNRNRAASYARGEFLMSVDSDDMLLVDTMAKCILLFKEYPQASFGIFSLNNSVTSILRPEETLYKHFFEKPMLLYGPGSSVIRNKYFREIGGFPTKYGPANDGYYNLKAASRTETILIPFGLIYYRRHEGQEINNQYSYLYNNYAYFRDALLELDLPLSQNQKSFLFNKNKRRFLTNIIRYYWRTKKWEQTRKAVKLADFSINDAMKAVFHSSRI